MKKKLIIISICLIFILSSINVYADDLEQQKTAIEEQQIQTQNEIDILQIQ